MDRCQNIGSVMAVSPRHCPATCALRNCCFNCCAWIVTKTMSVAPLLMNNLDNSKQKRSNLLSPAPPPYSWSLLGKSEGPAPPPSSKISWSFDLNWNLRSIVLREVNLYQGTDSCAMESRQTSDFFYIALSQHIKVLKESYLLWQSTACKMFRVNPFFKLQNKT